MARTPIDSEMIRIRVMLLLMLLAFGLLTGMLWKIQVAQSVQYEDDELRQSMRRVRLPGTRGRIFDRSGEVLADNRPGFSVAIYLEEVRQPGAWSRTVDYVESLLDEQARLIGKPREVTREDIQTHRRRRLPLPLIAWRDLDEAVVARWAESTDAMAGVDIYTDAVRVYPHGSLAAHTIGYVGRADPIPDEAEPFHYYLPEMEGKSGMERHLDEIMRGAAGGRLMRVDVVGYRHDDVAVREPGIGRDVRLTIDVGVQRIAEEVLGETPGAVVVMDVRTGEVLALASAPGYDLNAFIPGITTANWRALLEDERTPLMHRAAAGAFAPGSIFKPIVAIATLENRAVNPTDTINCTGSFELGRRFHCWARHGHGPLNMRESLERSCNVYYYRSALHAGYDMIYHTAVALGLGRRTGIELHHEVSGLMPNDAWKRRVHGDAWRDGDTVNLSIGQGPITVTPLQMAVVTAAIANGGYVHKPRIIAGIREVGSRVFTPYPHPAPHNLNWSASTLAVVRGGMRDAVMTSVGTARLARIPGIEMAGKTGTAEFGPKDEGRKHAWMIAFAPVQQAQYAVLVMTDEGLSGGQTAAPKVGRIMRHLFGLEQPQPAGGAS